MCLGSFFFAIFAQDASLLRCVYVCVADVEEPTLIVFTFSIFSLHCNGAKKKLKPALFYCYCIRAFGYQQEIFSEMFDNGEYA